LPSPSTPPKQSCEFEASAALATAAAMRLHSRSVRVSPQLSEETIFGFLTATRLPVVSSLAAVIRWISFGLGIVCAVFGIACLCLYDQGLWSTAAPWSGALPALTAAPFFLAAWLDYRARRLQRAGTLIFVALFLFTILANWPRGTFSPAWYLHPILALAATTSLGVMPGLTLTLVAVVAMLLATQLQDAETMAPGFATIRWVHTTSLAAVTLASALAGAIVNRLVFMALVNLETQRRNNLDASRALRHREKLLRHALRVETIGDLAGMVCHQLRNTFQVLLGHLTLASNADDAERVARLASMEDALQQTRPLLDQLMRMAHPDEGTTVPCELATVVRQFHTQAASVLPGSIALTCEVASESSFVLLNPNGLVHALWNLVINAKQAIVGEGAIRLRCGSDRHQVWLEVADTGSGMPAEVQNRIFDPYFTTKPLGQGTGLGLTAVKRFVQSSHGLIQVESEVGKGTTFRLRFPRATAVETEAHHSRADGEAAAG
jgi:signal transduction histidine kinase